MRIRSDSRFRTTALYAVDDEQRWGLPARAKLDDEDQYVIHRASDGERMDQIATRYYGNPRLWWVIAEVNDLFRWWDEIETGVEIKIPTREALARILSQ